MTTRLRGPRTADYGVLRVCERLGMAPAAFEELEFPEQLRLLAYERLRQCEERAVREWPAQD